MKAFIIGLALLCISLAVHPSEHVKTFKSGNTVITLNVMRLIVSYDDHTFTLSDDWEIEEEGYNRKDGPWSRYRIRATDQSGQECFVTLTYYDADEDRMIMVAPSGDRFKMRLIGEELSF